MWKVYSLYSVKFNRIYIGMSENPELRLEHHNQGKVKSTKAFVPWVIVFTEEVGERVEARSREMYYKTAAGRKKIRSIIEKKFPKL